MQPRWRYMMIRPSFWQMEETILTKSDLALAHHFPSWLLPILTIKLGNIRRIWGEHILRKWRIRVISKLQPPKHYSGMDCPRRPEEAMTRKFSYKFFFDSYGTPPWLATSKTPIVRVKTRVFNCQILNQRQINPDSIIGYLSSWSSQVESLVVKRIHWYEDESRIPVTSKINISPLGLPPLAKSC